MIKIVEQEKPYKPDLGDLVCDFCKKLASNYLVHEEAPLSKKIIPLVIIYPNPWIAAKSFDIDTTPIQAIYKCPYTGYTHYSIVPSALIVNGDVKAYAKLKHHSPEYILDLAWHQKMIRQEDLYGLSAIQRIILGSGYTEGTHINDGGGSIVTRQVMLDNGDALLVHFWEWYNK